jgi:hypothetical protein
MLEHMGKTLAVGLLIFGPYVVPNLNGNDGTGKVLERNYAQAVIEESFAVIEQNFLAGWDLRGSRGSGLDNFATVGR